MRPFRLLLLLIFFVAVPIFLTFLSLTSVHDDASVSWSNGAPQPQSRFRALFSFSTPSSLFPPTAIISLTDDNSTFFISRPAAFGPVLPARGFSGRLWVGKGFGQELTSADGLAHAAGWEFGCSDVPDWVASNAVVRRSSLRDDKAAVFSASNEDANARHEEKLENINTDNYVHRASTDENSQDEKSDDGTDDHLHHPLQDSNPAKAAKSGESASHDLGPAKAGQSTHADIESLQESADIAGKIVLLARGGCGFLEKVKWTQRRGGVALIVGDNERGAALTIMYAKGDTSNITVPAVFTSFTSAQILSSLVPYEDGEIGLDGGKLPTIMESGPMFTTTTSILQQQTIVPAKIDKSDSSVLKNEKGWAQNVLNKIGMSEEEKLRHNEDSRRPPSSGNINWVLVEDWDEEDSKQKNAKSRSTDTATATTSVLSKSTTSIAHRPTVDDFVIGVQDWRDVDLVAPRPALKEQDSKIMEDGQHIQSVDALIPNPGGHFKGGSITPGSGEYEQSHAKDHSKETSDSTAASDKPSTLRWLKFWRAGASVQGKPITEGLPTSTKPHHRLAQKHPKGGHRGLWLTMTPTSVSSSPFFDTLLVLVISPLVTLSVVYALLVLRSRIRRRRWRAPKSVVDQLPVRTYHTTSTSSSTTSSQVSTPNQASPASSPFLRPTPRDIQSRARPRSQTSNDIPASSSLPATLNASNSSLFPDKHSVSTQTHTSHKRKRYTGRQIECVVCLEEYVDGESRVMSLPCGHEFHADCITPWLVNRRRTCPICKGDVVRSLAKSNGSGAATTADERQEGDETSDGVQDRVAETSNENPSSAIPIPSINTEADDDILMLEDDDDIERGHDRETQVEPRGAQTESTATSSTAGRWRNVLGSSLTALSGDTLFAGRSRAGSRGHPTGGEYQADRSR